MWRSFLRLRILCLRAWSRSTSRHRTCSRRAFSGAVDLCIDHHPSNALYAGDTLLHAEKSACGEAVLELIELLTGSVTEQEANLLYIAVTTDTGCFQYANTNAATLRAAARLLELGADNRKISMDFFRKISRARMALVGQIYSGMRFFRDGQVAIAVVTRALIDSVHATEDDCDDIAGLPGRAEGVVVSVTIRELADGRSKISVRSNPEVDSCAICAVYGGGGHKMASGCTLACDTETAVEKILAAIDQVWPA